MSEVYSMANISKNANKKNSAFSPAILVALAVILVTVIALAFTIVHYTGTEASSEAESETSSDLLKGTYYAELEMEDGGKIVMELYADIAPITVTNFVKLVQENFYDGLTFHRVMSGFMIQGGDPNGDGTGGSEEKIFGEFSSNGFENNLSHTRGVISMARRGDPYKDSASSQFFIVHADSVFLDGSYAAFGRVISGMDVVDKIAAVKTNPSNNRPLEAVVIKTIRMIENPAA